MKDRKDIAKEINLSIKKLGSSSHKAIIEQIKLRYYPFFRFFIDKKFNYENYSTLNSVSSSMENVINSSKKVLNNNTFYWIKKASKILLFLFILWIIGVFGFLFSL